MKNQTNSHFWLPLGGLAGLLILSELVYLALLKLNAINGWESVLTFWLEMGALFVFYALAAVLVWRFENIRKQAVWLIIVGAILFRITLLPAGIPFDLSASEKLDAMQTDLQGTEVTYERFQLFDNDIWRYIWEGHASAHGFNPYQFAPNNAELDVLTDEVDENDLTDEREVWTDIRDNVNYAGVSTIYPPLAQFIFWLSHAFAPGSLLMMKILLIVCELIGILFLGLTLRLLELRLTSVILYAWNPLMIKVFAGSGHADAILVAMLCITAYCIARGFKTLGAIAFGLAILAKLSPIFLLPFIARRVGWLKTLLIGAVVFIGYLPFLDAGRNLFRGFLTFASEWQFNYGVFGLVQWFADFISANPSDLARKICGVLILTIVAWLVWRDDLTDKYFVKASAIVLGGLIVLSPTVMPWYLSWVLPFAVLARQYVWIYFSAIVLTAFHILIDQNEYALALWFEHGLFFALLFVWIYRRKFMGKFAEDKI